MSFLSSLILFFIKGATTVGKLGGLVHGERGARAYNGGLGAVPQWGSGAKPLKLTTFLHLKVNLNNKNCIIFCIIYAINNATISAGTLLKDREAQILQPNCIRIG